jgi:hypothetical protein
MARKAKEGLKPWHLAGSQTGPSSIAKMGNLICYTVTVIREDLVDVRVSEPKAADPTLQPGVEVRISELDRAYRSLEPDQAINSLSQIFALYLTDYSELSIFVEH